MHLPLPLRALGSAPAAPIAPAAAPCRAVGEGASFASFGEIVQGQRSDGEDFLITLPVDRWSRGRVSWEAIDGPSRVDAELVKSRRVAEELLRLLGLGSGLRLRVELAREMPIGKGLSSSTADMLAVVRACQALFSVQLSDTCISRLFARIEPHDALHYPTSVAYNHRRGRLLARFDYTPDFQIVAVDAGGEVCTEAYNGSLDFCPGLRAEYDLLYRDAVSAFAARDDAAIARCALRSTRLHVERTGNPFLRRLLALAGCLDVLGLVATHSGTCGGFLLSGHAAEDVLAGVEAAVAHRGAVFRTRTLSPSCTTTGRVWCSPTTPPGR